MFFSLRSLGVPVEQSVALSLIPLLLGALDLLTAFAYSLTGFVLILACSYYFLAGYHLHPDDLAADGRQAPRLKDSSSQVA